MLQVFLIGRRLEAKNTQFMTVSIPGEVLPYMGYINMCSPKGYGFSANLVINRVSTLAILVINRVWFLYSSLELGLFLEEDTFSSYLSIPFKNYV